MNINKDELIVWFWEKFNSCYLVKHDDYPESVFMFYDPQYIRKLKLANISGEKINKTDITGVCLFELDWKNKTLWCKYNEIWEYLSINYSNKYKDIQSFIKGRLMEHTKLGELTPNAIFHPKFTLLMEHTKLGELTPNFRIVRNADRLMEHTKLGELTPVMTNERFAPLLMEHTKLGELTPMLSNLRTSPPIAHLKPLRWRNTSN